MRRVKKKKYHTYDSSFICNTFDSEKSNSDTNSFLDFDHSLDSNEDEKKKSRRRPKPKYKPKLEKKMEDFMGMM